MNNNNKTASLLIVGNEILSGRTQDLNLNYIAKKLSDLGVDFEEARVVRDSHDQIASALNELREIYDYVFTTGGIGPTHDDITTEAVAKAFNVPVIENPKARSALEKYYENKDVELNEARLRMAQTPEGAVLIDNPMTSAPGYRMENVFVLAGIPKIMQVMFDCASEHLEVGKKIFSKSVSCNLVEGDIAKGLNDIQVKYPQIEIGSYPFIHDSKYAVSLVVRGYDTLDIDAAVLDIKEIISKLRGNIISPN
jgi:molybdenum cofactor synthesis domain-containing protein